MFVRLFYFLLTPDRILVLARNVCFPPLTTSWLPAGREVEWLEDWSNVVGARAVTLQFFLAFSLAITMWYLLWTKNTRNEQSNNLREPNYSKDPYKRQNETSEQICLLSKWKKASRSILFSLQSYMLIPQNIVIASRRNRNRKMDSDLILVMSLINQEKG